MTPQSTIPNVPDQQMAEIILALCAERTNAKTICPTDAAKAIAAATGGGDLAWRGFLQRVRGIAIALARQGQLVVYRKGKPVDPDDFCGVYRLGLPRSD